MSAFDFDDLDDTAAANAAQTLRRKRASPQIAALAKNREVKDNAGARGGAVWTQGALRGEGQRAPALESDDEEIPESPDDEHDGGTQFRVTAMDHIYV